MSAVENIASSVATRSRPADLGAAAAEQVGLRAQVVHANGGFTIIELLVSMTLGLIVFGAALTVMIAGLHTQNHSMNRVSAAQTLASGVAEMVDELRPGASVAYKSGKANLGIVLTPPSTVIPPGGVTAGTPVTYDCYTTTGTCVRSVGGTVTGSFATNVGNTDIFTLKCRTAVGDLQAVANGGSTVGCANAGALDYVAIRLVGSVGCAGQGVPLVSCSNGTIEIDDGTALRSAP